VNILGRIKPDRTIPGRVVCPGCNQTRAAIWIVYAEERGKRARLLTLCLPCYHAEKRKGRVKWRFWRLVLKLAARAPRQTKAGATDPSGKPLPKPSASPPTVKTVAPAPKLGRNFVRDSNGEIVDMTYFPMVQ
jgi:hypothetical protein